MRCPYCDGDTRVADTREREQGFVQRKRRCAGCSQVFSTVERISTDSLLVRKRSGESEEFDRAKLRKGIAKAASVYRMSAEEVDVFVERVSARLQPTPGIPITSGEIARLVMQELQDGRPTTDVARVRFGIVSLGRRTRNSTGFRGVHDFLEWLDGEYPDDRVEEPGPAPTLVVKRKGLVENFRQGHLERSIGVAAKGRGTDEEMHLLASTVAMLAVRELQGQAIVTAGQISAEVLKLLRHRDKLAYLRYASSVKLYRSVQDFWREALALRED